MKNKSYQRIRKTKCWGCDGKGYNLQLILDNQCYLVTIDGKIHYAKQCDKCNGTGEFVEKDCFVIVEKDDGTKIGFLKDTLE